MEKFTLYLSDIIDKTGIAHDNIAAIRHTKCHKKFNDVWKEGFKFFEEYQKIQPPNYFHGKEYVFSFVGEAKNTARLIAVYKVNKIKPLSEDDVSVEYWNKFGNTHNLN